MLGLAACGGDDPSPEATAASAPAPVATQAPATRRATLAPVPGDTPEPVSPTEPPKPEPTEETERPATETPAVSGAPEPTAPAAMTEAEKLAAYAAEHANGPGAIFVGDPKQLIGPPPHEALKFEFPDELYSQVAGLGLVGSAELGVPSHMFIYTSDYTRT